MLRQLTLRRTDPINGDLKKSRNLFFQMLLVAITGTAIALVALPALLPMLGPSSFGLTTEAYSHITRSSALVAYMLLWVSMLAGLSITSKTGRKWPGMSLSFGLHRHTTLLGLGFAGIHALSILGGQHMNYTLGQVLVPFAAGGYKPQWVGLGQLALYAFAIVALSFYVRNRLGVRTWRLIHSLSFALFLMALLHGLQIGSDSGAAWAKALYWVSAGSVLLGSVLRVMAARRGRSRAQVAATGLVAVGGKSQSRAMPRVLNATYLSGRDQGHASPQLLLVREQSSSL